MTDLIRGTAAGFRSSFVLIALIGLARSASGQSLYFILPSADQKSATVIVGESLSPDVDLKSEGVVAKLVTTDDTGHDTPATLKPGNHGLVTEVPGKKTRVIHGTLTPVGELDGLHGSDIVDAKAIFGDPFDPKTKTGSIEFAPTGGPGKLKFQLLAKGQPVPSTDVTVILPDGGDQKLKTDPNGEVGPFNVPGRYGVRARYIAPGNHTSADHIFATLVVDAPAVVSRTDFPPMPEKASSFGAVACDGWLYVYGGHTADTHDYSEKTVSGEFHRISLTDPKQWESLPGGPKLQGLNLAAYHGKIYRVGGMSPHNKDDQTEDVRSTADCAVYDPATKLWAALPPMPEPRSSHDVAVAGDCLVVVGGWSLTGDSDEAKWLETALVMDLSAAKPVWKTVKQPFKRRALIAAALDNKVYVIGGFLTESDATLAVDIYDPKSDVWSKGPDLPGPEMNGFGPAACVDGDTLYVSVGNGSLFALNKTKDGWDRIARTTPRIVHRMVPAGEKVLILGGAAGQQQTDLIETADVKPK